MTALKVYAALKEFKSFLIGISLAVVGVIVTYSSWNEYHARSELKDHGRLTTATPIAWHASEDQKTHELSDFTLNLRYVTDQGQTITAENIPVPSDIGLEVRRGRFTALKIRYLPERPSIARLAMDISSHAIELSLGFLLLAGGIAMTVFLVLRRVTTPANR